MYSTNAWYLHTYLLGESTMASFQTVISMMTWHSNMATQNRYLYLEKYERYRQYSNGKPGVFNHSKIDKSVRKCLHVTEFQSWHVKQYHTVYILPQKIYRKSLKKITLSLQQWTKLWPSRKCHGFGVMKEKNPTLTPLQYYTCVHYTVLQNPDFLYFQIKP